MTPLGNNVKIGEKLTIQQTGISNQSTGPASHSSVESKEAPASSPVVIGEATHCTSCFISTFKPQGTFENIDFQDVSLLSYQASFSLDRDRIVVVSVQILEGFSASNSNSQNSGHKNGVFQLVLEPSGRGVSKE